jgi:hypothetical protein
MGEKKECDPEWEAYLDRVAPVDKVYSEDENEEEDDEN